MKRQSCHAVSSAFYLLHIASKLLGWTLQIMVVLKRANFTRVT